MVSQIKCVDLQYQFRRISLKVKAAILRKTLFVFWLRQEVHYGSYLLSWISVKDSIILMRIKHQLLMA